MKDFLLREKKSIIGTNTQNRIFAKTSLTARIAWLISLSFSLHFFAALSLSNNWNQSINNSFISGYKRETRSNWIASRKPQQHLHPYFMWLQLLGILQTKKMRFSISHFHLLYNELPVDWRACERLARQLNLVEPGQASRTYRKRPRKPIKNGRFLVKVCGKNFWQSSKFASSHSDKTLSNKYRRFFHRYIYPTMNFLTVDDRSNGG